MANLKNFCDFYDMHMHKGSKNDILAKDIDQLLLDFLPRIYADKVVIQAAKKKIEINTDPRYIRDVRNGRYKDASVFMCILEVAELYKNKMKKLKSTIEKVAV